MTDRNVGKKWSSSEEENLINEINIYTISEIARRHSRTSGGIKSRINHIAYNMYLQNTPKDEILSKLNMQENELQEIIDKKSNSSNPKKYDELNNKVKLLEKSVELLTKNVEILSDLLLTK